MTGERSAFARLVDADQTVTKHSRGQDRPLSSNYCIETRSRR